jgi:GH25 family lysozyme M1 (1,4-beta-N-acetylmuramidase)
MNSIHGIDLSEHNGNNTDEIIANTGFVMIRTGYGSKNRTKQEDKQVYNNVKKCIKYGKPFGYYHYSYATTKKLAEDEADFCLSIVDKVSNQGNRPLYPIAYDIEDKKLDKLTIAQRTDLCIAFCDKIEKAGYYAVIYASRNYFRQKLDLKRLERFDKWVADWTKTTDETLQKSVPCGMRQYTVDRSKNIDKNIAFKDYPTIIKKMYDSRGQKTNTPKELKVGSVVRVLKPIIYGTKKKFIQYYDCYEVLQIAKIFKNRIVIGRGKTVTAAIDRKNLEVIR